MKLCNYAPFLPRLREGYLMFLSHSFSGKSLSSSVSRNNLYRRITPIGNPRDSIIPVLDQWVEEGREVDPQELRNIVHGLKSFRRYKHALEISQWMTDRRYIPPLAEDVAVRMNLIRKVHGINEAEIYFNNIPDALRSFQVYVALLNCYSSVRDAENAETVMEKMKKMGFIRTPLCYNLLMNLYYHTREFNRVDCLMIEMEENGINYDKYSYAIRISAFAAASDIDGMEKTLVKMESDPHVVMEWEAYAIVASAYLRVGEVDKALKFLGKIELLLGSIKRKGSAFRSLLKHYSEAGKKDDVYRIWEIYRKTEKVYNWGYLDMLFSVMRFDDIDGAEAILEEWELKGLSYDFRIPDVLIGFYCRNGMLDKAEALVYRGIEKGGDPSVTTWCCLANGYLETDCIVKAVEVLKKAIKDFPLNWKPSKEVVESCLLYLEGKGDPDLADKLAESLRVTGIFSDLAIDRVLSCGDRLITADK